MKGLDLARAFFEETADELFGDTPSELRERATVGLVGEGSECFGFDDESSRDHDWGAGFCVWLSDGKFERYGAELAERYERLAARESFRGFPVRPAATEQGVQRVGVFSAAGFYRQVLGTAHAPETVAEWQTIPEAALAVATNGELFFAGDSGFAETRERLLSYYPEDLRLKRMASCCLVMAQAGQYNYPRMLNRGDTLAALQALDRFCEAAIALAHGLARRFRPYYKWAARSLEGLDGAGGELHSRLEALVRLFQEREYERSAEQIEGICALAAGALREQGLSGSEETFFVAQAAQVNARIEDDALRSAPLLPAIPR